MKQGFMHCACCVVMHLGLCDGCRHHAVQSQTGCDDNANSFSR